MLLASGGGSSSSSATKATGARERMLLPVMANGVVPSVSSACRASYRMHEPSRHRSGSCASYRYQLLRVCVFNAYIMDLFETCFEISVKFFPSGPGVLEYENMIFCETNLSSMPRIQ